MSTQCSRVLSQQVRLLDGLSKQYKDFQLTRISTDAATRGAAEQQLNQAADADFVRHIFKSLLDDRVSRADLSPTVLLHISPFPGAGK